ncbi:phytanoyl-CoA dioxygenase family protein [Pseudomonas sp. C2L12B]|nr:phytanoyl-CoA dioxygenase family protein [Pseudomonas typographi]
MPNQLTTLPGTASVEEVVQVIERDGGVVIADFLDSALLHKLQGEVENALTESSFGQEDGFVGTSTRRASRLFARTKSIVDVASHPLFVGAARHILQKPVGVWFGEELKPVTPMIQVGMTQAIQVHPGQGKQPLHRDDTVFLWRHPEFGREARLQIMVAVTDFTEANGATRVIPGSHLWDDLRPPKQSESVPAEMRAGSAALFVGSLYHGAGMNDSDAPRTGVTMSFDLGHLRQEENQYLSVPINTLKILPEEVQRWLGWETGETFIGYVEKNGKMTSPYLFLESEDVLGEFGWPKENR